MKPLPFIRNIRRQRGDFLIESLIGALLIGIVGIGIGHTYRKVTTTQAASQEQAIVISNMTGLAKGGQAALLCGGGADTKGFAIQADSSGCSADTRSQITLNGVNIPVRPAPVIEAIKLDENNNPINVRIGQTIGRPPAL